MSSLWKPTLTQLRLEMYGSIISTVATVYRGAKAPGYQ